jgi:hypothetical protein
VAGPADPNEIRELLEQLSQINAMSAEIAQRLDQLGAGRAAQAIVGGPIPPPAPPAAPPAPPPQPAPTPEQPEEPEDPEPPEEPPELPPEKPQERYLLNGSSIHIPFLDPTTAFQVMLRVWNEAKIGSPRKKVGEDANGRPIMVPTDASPKYGADAVARGTSLDPGIQIPPEAMRSESAFAKWADDHGLGQGLAIEIDGLVAKPGRTVTSSEGAYKGAQKRTYTVKLDDDGASE